VILIRADGSGRDAHPGMAFLGVPPTWYVPAQAQATPTPVPTPTGIPNIASQLAYVQAPFGNAQYDLFLVQDNSISAPILQQLTLYGARQPMWSPDRRSIAFVANMDNPQNTAYDDLFLLDVATLSVRRLTNHLESPPHSPFQDRSPVWSPDSKQLLFSSNRTANGNSDLFVLNVEPPFNVRNWTNTADVNETYPTWSVNDEIAYISDQGGSVNLYKGQKTAENEPLSGQLLLTSSANFSLTEPRWSPEGRRLAFTALAMGSNTLTGSVIALWEAETGHLYSLTPPSAGFFDFSPSWSPDGSSIAFFSNRGGQNDIYVIAAKEHSTAVPVSIGAHIDKLEPSWSSGSACTIRFVNDTQASADLISVLAGAPANPITILGLPPNSSVTSLPVSVIRRHLSTTVVLVAYEGNLLWVDTSNVQQATGDCAQAIQRDVPTATPFPAAYTPPPLPADFGLLCSETGGTTLGNGAGIDPFQCRYAKRAFNTLTDALDKVEIERMVQILQAAETPDNLLEFELRVERYFCVNLGAVGQRPNLTYQHVGNIFLALFHTAYAFQKTDPTLGSVHETACRIFRHRYNQLTITRRGQQQQGGETFGWRIDLYDNSSIPHTSENIVHELGHFINFRLGGSPANPAPGSPLGLLAAGQLRDSYGDLISKPSPDNTKWIRGGGLRGDPFTQNSGIGCPDSSCGANEEIADMFLHWVYDVIMEDVFVDDAGKARRKFINSRMFEDTEATPRPGYGWICKLSNNDIQLCR